ncbi:hypothetical protein Tco_0813810 [Tanacetum coccineum]
MPLRKRARFTAPTGRFEVGESSSAVAARQAGHTLAHKVDYGFIDTMDAIIHAFECRAVTAMREDDRALLRDQVSLLTRERRYFCSMASSYEHEAADARRAWAHSKSRSQAMEAHIRAFQRDVDRHDRRMDQLMLEVAVLITQGVATALAEYEAQRSSGNGDDSHESRSGRRTERATHECTYSDFLKYQALNFKGTEGVVGLTQWFEKMESVFHISNCIVVCQIKFATCTLLGIALTWWNSHVKTVGHDAAYGLPWKTLKKLMNDNYNQHFQELALMCSRMFPEESDEVEKYVSGLPDMIKGSVMASKTKTMQDAIEFAIELMDQKI